MEIPALVGVINAYQFICRNSNLLSLFFIKSSCTMLTVQFINQFLLRIASSVRIELLSLREVLTHLMPHLSYGIRVLL